MSANNASTPGTQAVMLPSGIKKDEYLRQLKGLAHSVSELKAAGYVVAPLSESDLERKKRCIKCGCRCSQRERKPKPPKGNPGKKEEQAGNQPESQTNEVGAKNAKEVNYRCKFHPGKVVAKTWTCCNAHVSSKPCSGSSSHEPRPYTPGELERRWQFHPTPPPSSPPNSPNNNNNKKQAIAIDCEMGTARDGEKELIRLTAIDYFTGEVLVDSLVYPDVDMLCYDTRYSGVTRGDMERARRQVRCLLGKGAARRALWSFVGPETVVVGHSAQNDLAALRWVHTCVVDSFLLEVGERRREEEQAKEREGKKDLKGVDSEGVSSREEKGGEAANEGGKAEDGKAERLSLSLKDLALRKLGREIQTRGRKGHDSLEDAVTSRDLAHRHIENLIKPLQG
ncbi:hypothetical protein N656DRAFT_849561 [Canariomyces notabilis]|uniref:Exonuclease domain-containing protein n=1 Tax=Canariomyces notabilis TaxID=2074819 RepID=A0AAN6QBQ5_9PEZI|nr:hypothetical protein N656DRAFT_849561 [Canariomyces arenarius]